MPALFAMIAFIFIPFFAKSLTVLLVGEILQGVSWGVFQTMTISYAAEVCPLAIRHWLTSFVNLCWFIGGFISAGVLRGLLDHTDIWGYRIPFALQWIWPVPILVGTFLAPESPWYYVKKGQKDRARRSLMRLARKDGQTQRDIDRQLALLVYTNEMEKTHSAGVSYLDCFKGTELRRTEIVCMVWVAQTMCGSSLGGLQSCKSRSLAHYPADASQTFIKTPGSRIPMRTTSVSVKLLLGWSARWRLGLFVSRL